MRLGKIRAPYYRIVVADSRTKREGRVIETIGKYHPKQEPSLIEVDSDRARYWLSVGAQPTEPVAAILKLTGDWQAHKGEPAPEGGVKTAAPKQDRKAAFDAAARETLESDDKPAKKTAAKKTAAKKSAAKKTAESDTETDTAAEPAADAEATAGDAPATEPAAAEEPTAPAAEEAAEQATTDTAAEEARAEEAAATEAEPAAPAADAPPAEETTRASSHRR